MDTISSLKSNPNNSLVWVSSALALFTTAAYILIAKGFLSIGDPTVTAGDNSIIFVAASCYFLGGLLIHLQRRWLWMIGFLINFLVMLFYFSMYGTRPEIFLSAGGLITKGLQVLLEITLLLLTVRSGIINHKRLM